jgi:hypothetical protein
MDAMIVTLQRMIASRVAILGHCILAAHLARKGDSHRAFFLMLVPSLSRA